MLSHGKANHREIDQGASDMSGYFITTAEEDKFIARIDDRLDALHLKIVGHPQQGIVGEVEELLCASNKQIAYRLSAWHPINRDRHSSEVVKDKERFIAELVARYKSVPLFQRYVDEGTKSSDPNTLVVPSSSDIPTAQRVNEERKEQLIVSAVTETVNAVLSKLRLKEEDSRLTFLLDPRVDRNDPESPLDVDRIIRESKPSQVERDRADSLGLNDKASLIALRESLTSSFWGAHILGAAALCELPAPVNIGAVAGLTVANLAVQFFAGIKLENRVNIMLQKVEEFARTSRDMESKLFWTAHLYKVVRDNNPLLIAKNRTDVWNAEAGSSVRVLLRSLHEAMVHAGRKMAEDPIDKPIHFMVQDRVVDGLLDRAHPEIGNLAARWRAPADAYLGVSTWTATLSSLAFVGSLL